MYTYNVSDAYVYREVRGVLQDSPVRNSHLFLSVSDSRASNTAAPIRRYVKVHTTSESVLTFWRFIAS